MEGILVWGGCAVAFLIGGFAGIASWMLAVIVGYLLMVVWGFFRAFYWPTPKMKEAREKALCWDEEEERRFAQWRWERQGPLPETERERCYR